MIDLSFESAASMGGQFVSGQDESADMDDEFAASVEHPNPARGAGVLKGTWARPTAQAAGLSSAKSASSLYVDCVASYIFDC